MKERKTKRKSYHLIPRSIHESKQKEKLLLGLGEPAIADAQVLTFRLKVPPPPN
jgi:hypothetical protein